MSYGIADVMNLLRLINAGDASDRQRRIERQKIEALIGYCETVSCRRQVLLGYFGERDHPPCGNCDNCRQPVASWEGTIAAQKALSAVYRTGQRFGAHYLVDVLLGADSERIKRLGHNRLKTFAVGTELDRRGWLSVFRQLVAQGFVIPDLGEHGGLSLAPAAAEVLRGRKTVHFRLDPAQQGQKPRSRDQKSAAVAAGFDAIGQSLWEALRAWRLEEASRQKLPPYVIFHDTTLIEIARRRPSSPATLGEIPGIGRSKLERYGSAVTAVIAATTEQKSSLA
jgi:ATP-dependent DNA helicase RecQ